MASHATSAATAGSSGGATHAVADPLDVLLAAVRRERRPGEPLDHALHRIWIRERDRLDWATITAFRRAGEVALGPAAAVPGCPTAQGDTLAYVGFVAVASRRIGPSG